MKRRFRQLSTLALYFAIPAFGAATPFVVFPALTSTYGPSGLTAIAVGQSLGASAAIIAELGWSVLGPQVIARSNIERRNDLFQSAFATRLLALAVVAPIAVYASYLIASEHKTAAAFIALAFSLSALSPSWFLIGCNKPLLILAVEVSPRFILSLACALLIRNGQPLEVYGLAILIAALSTWLLTAWRIKQRPMPRWRSFHDGIAIMRTHLPLTLGRMVSVLYTSLPVTLVAIVAPTAVATFVGVDRLIRMAATMLGGVPSRLQSWIGADSARTGSPRSRYSLIINALLGLASSVGFVILAPYVADIVFSGVVNVSVPLAAVGGLVIFAICTSRGFGLSLVAENRGNWIAAANIGAASVGVPAVLILAHFWGGVGGLLGTLAAECVGILIQCFALFLGHRGTR